MAPDKIDCLVISISARALALAARRSGYNVHCIDAFSDQDTQKFSLSSQTIPFEIDRFDEQALFDVVDRFLLTNPDICIVTGSGFEAATQQLSHISHRSRLYANSSDTIEKLKNPVSFARLLEAKQFKHPSTFNKIPDDDKPYIIKRNCGVGGDHIRYLKGDVQSLDEQDYVQEYIEGRVFSVLFLANGKQVSCVGFNVQQQTSQFPEMPFLYKGAVSLNQNSLNLFTAQQRNEINRILKEITLATGLMGLCGMDFILTEEGEIFVLEINPRPPATFELHDHEGDLFAAHLSCFEQGAIRYQPNPARICRASSIIFADSETQMSEWLSWPDWVSDRPDANSIISSRSPICTVHSEGESIAEAIELLKIRVAQIESEIIKMKQAA